MFCPSFVAPALSCLAVPEHIPVMLKPSGWNSIHINEHSEIKFQQHLLIKRPCFVSLISIGKSMEQVKIVPQQVFPHFMQRTRPVACCQERTTSPYPEPHDLSTHPANMS